MGRSLVHKILSMTVLKSHELVPIRVKAGNFGRQVNSDIHLQTVEIQMRRLLMSKQ